MYICKLNINGHLFKGGAKLIDLLYIRDTTRHVIDIIDAFESVIWDSVYFGVGNFEIYTELNEKTLNALKTGYYVTRADRRDVGIIENININYTAGGALMITAAGRFVKSILDRRLIYALDGNTVNPVIMRGNVETAVRNLINTNAIAAADQARNIPFLTLGTPAGLTAVIRDDSGRAADKQTSYGNLLEITEKLLEGYNYGAYMSLDDNYNFVYNVYEGATHAAGSAHPIIFSQEFDNLLNSNYSADTTNIKTAALCGGEGEGTARKYVLIAGSQTGLDRREMFVDGSSNSQSYKDQQGAQQQYSDAQYLGMLNTTAGEALAQHKTIENFDGAIDLTNSVFVYGRDYSIGDIITIGDNNLNINHNARIMEITEVQDSSGYAINAVFSNLGE